MKRTWASPSKTWEGFRRTKYYLDDRLLSLPLISAEKESTTLGAFYTDCVSSSDIQELEVEDTGLGGIEIRGPGLDKHTFIGKSFSCRILRLMIEFQKEGIQPFSTSWFWYDSDSSMEFPQDAYSFFVTFEDRIVRERVVLFDGSDTGFDPDILGDEARLGGSWSSDKASDRAEIRFWYSKFYNETREGQLVALRDDILRHFPTTEKMSVPTLLRKIYLLLWALLIIAVLIFLRSLHW